MKTRTHLNRKSNDSATPTTASQLQPRAFDTPTQADAQTESPTKSNGFDLSNISVLSSAAPIQAKLTIGEPNDKYEQEADQVAAQVVNQINSPQPAAQAGTVQREAMPEEEEELQMKPDLQREAMPEEEEELQMKPDLQREAMPEEEEELQMKPAVEATAVTPKKA